MKQRFYLKLASLCWKLFHFFENQYVEMMARAYPLSKEEKARWELVGETAVKLAKASRESLEQDMIKAFEDAK